MCMVLSSWQSHYCESSPGSFDECRITPSGRRPSYQVKRLKPRTHWQQSRPRQAVELPICSWFRQQSTFNKVDRVEFNFVASVYRALGCESACWLPECTPTIHRHSL